MLTKLTRARLYDGSGCDQLFQYHQVRIATLTPGAEITGGKVRFGVGKKYSSETY